MPSKCCCGLQSSLNVDRNPLVDGWRGLSVIFVIVGHLVLSRFYEIFHTEPLGFLVSRNPLSWIDLTKSIFFHLVCALPIIGVDIFFMISGYLITQLLVKEKIKFGQINIGAFYIRRGFRIVPAFALLLIAMSMSTAFGLVEIPTNTFIRSGIFICDLKMSLCDELLRHTWTLAVEQQFYPFWPLIFFLSNIVWIPRILALIFISWPLLISINAFASHL